MTGDRLSGVPNTPGTPRRSIRVPDELWREAQELAQEQGLDLSAVIRADLARHVKKWRKTRDPKQP